MELPFAREQFFDVFAAYNRGIFPLQLIAALLGLLILILAFARRKMHRQLALGLLAVLWLLTGVGYHLLYFTAINKAAYLFGALFILQAGLLCAAAWRIEEAKLGRNLAATILGLASATYGVAGYPVLVLLDHGYPRAPLFGVTPCPTTIFTFGVLLLLRPKVPRYLLIVPVLWGAVGGSAAVLLGVPQDYGLLVALVGGLAGFWLLRDAATNGKRAADS